MLEGQYRALPETIKMPEQAIRMRATLSVSNLLKGISKVKNVRLFDIEFQDTNAIDFLQNLAKDSFSSKSVHLIAVSTLVATRKDKELSRRINRGAAVCDSKIIEFVLRIFYPKYRRIRGVDFLRNFLLFDSPSNKHFFLGSNEKTLVQLKKVISELSPEIKIVGLLSPPYSDAIDWRGCSSEIASTGANVVWVSLGSPKQDFVASQISDFLGVRVIAIGAAIDFFAKQKREAPIIFQNLGLEWAYRLVSEPRRLWKRYLIGNSIFLLYLPSQILKNLLKVGVR